MKRGDIYYADLDPVLGSEQGGIRPILILQNNVCNNHSTTVIVATITSKYKQALPTHVHIGDICKLSDKPYVQLQQIKTIDKLKLQRYVGTLSKDQMKEIDKALKLCVGL